MLRCKEVAPRAHALNYGELFTSEALQLCFRLAICKGCERFAGKVRVMRDLTRITADPGKLIEADDGRISAILSQFCEARQKGGSGPRERIID